MKTLKRQKNVKLEVLFKYFYFRLQMNIFFFGITPYNFYSFINDTYK